MSIAKRIKNKRLEFGLTQTGLADLVGITQQSLQKIEDGRTQNPRKLFNIAKALDCSAEWLQFGDSVQESPSNYHTEQFRPLIDLENISAWLQSTNLDPTTWKATSWFNVPNNTPKKAFWLKTVGDKMTSPSGLNIPEGYNVLVDPEKQAKNEDLVVLLFKDTLEITFMKFTILSGRPYVRHLHSPDTTMEVTDKITVLGVAKEARLIFC